MRAEVEVVGVLPAGANLLANAIRDISNQKPAEVGATPEIASAVSGKTYKFPGNPLNVKSLALSFADPHPHYDLEIYNQDQTKPSLKSDGPIGLDGVYRKGEPTASGIVAMRGKWSDGRTFVIERQMLGTGEEQKWTLSFDGERLHLRGKGRDGRDVSIDGEPGG